MNPYIAGSPISGTEMFFGREDVFSFVRRNLTGRHRDAPIVLYGQRRTGKTTVLYQLHRHLDSRYLCIFIDLHGLKLDGIGNLLWGIANSISRSLKRDHQVSVMVPDRAMFFTDPQAVFKNIFLDTVWAALGDNHLVLMVDEVVRLDEEVKAGRLEHQVFDYLRHLMQHFANLNFVFSLGSGLENMEKDYFFLFSVSLYHRISFLEPAAADALITQPVQGYYRITPDAVERIRQITSGHPYYTQLVCHCMFDRWLRFTNPAMTVADVDAVLAEAVELGSANLTYVWEDSTSGERATMAVMAAVLRNRSLPITVEDIREAWREIGGVKFPENEAIKAVRSLIEREVLVGERTYSFTVDLQRLWLEKHRRLDWVKEELAEAMRAWDQSAETGLGTDIAVRSPEPKHDGAERVVSAILRGPDGTLVGRTGSGNTSTGARSGSNGRGPLVAIVAVVAVLVVYLVIAGVARTFPFAKSRSPNGGASPTARTVAYSGLQTGNCIQTSSHFRLSDSKSAWPSTFRIVPCAWTHAGEVIFAGNGWAANARYPGYHALLNQSQARCVKAFSSYIGDSAVFSKLSWTWGRPSANTWAAGDRYMFCVAYSSSGPLHGTVRNTRR